MTAETTKITTERDTYTVVEPIGRGHLADLFLVEASRAVHVARPTGSPPVTTTIAPEYARKAVVKLAQSEAQNVYLDHELTVLDLLGVEAAKPRERGAPDYRMFIRTPIDIFLFQGRRAAVFPYIYDRFTLAEVHISLGRLTPLQMIWILRRMLTGLDWIHEKGFVHGALTPEHIFVPPSGEGWCPIVDWCYATTRGAPLKTVWPDARPYYPPEVLSKAAADTETDIFMLGQTAKTLLGYDEHQGYPSVVPAALAKLLNAMTEPLRTSRPKSASELHERLSRIEALEFDEDAANRRIDLPAYRF